MAQPCQVARLRRCSLTNPSPAFYLPAVHLSYSVSLIHQYTSPASALAAYEAIQGSTTFPPDAPAPPQALHVSFLSASAIPSLLEQETSAWANGRKKLDLLIVPPSERADEAGTEGWTFTYQSAGDVALRSAFSNHSGIFPSGRPMRQSATQQGGRLPFSNGSAYQQTYHGASSNSRAMESFSTMMRDMPPAPPVGGRGGGGGGGGALRAPPGPRASMPVMVAGPPRNGGGWTSSAGGSTRPAGGFGGRGGRDVDDHRRREDDSRGRDGGGRGGWSARERSRSRTRSREREREKERGRDRSRSRSRERDGRRGGGGSGGGGWRR